MPATTEGTRSEAFGGVEWGLLAAISLIWGSSFLLMDLGLEALRPGVVTVLRLALGAAALACIPQARRPVERADLPRVVLLGAVWMAGPTTLFPIAQQWIDSSLAGMLNAAVPLGTAAVAAVLLRRLPGTRQLIGLLVGLVGVVAISWPSVRTAGTTALGVALVLAAVALYAVAGNLAVPLQQRYGATPVLLRAQLAALLLTAPVGAVQVPGSSWSWGAVLAMLPLGVLGSGLAYVAMTTLVGRAGATRGSVAIYFVPLVAITAGVALRDERVAASAVVGVVLVLLGAWLTSRRDDREVRARRPGESPATVGAAASG